MAGTICYITGTIKDSGGSPVSGKLVITLDANLRDDSTNPDSLHTRVPKEYVITNGVIDDSAVPTPIGIGLLESETQEVTYFFQFFRLVSQGVYDTKALLDFHEIVPNVATAEFESLARETGITTTNLSTGAIKVAREILVNPVLSSLIFYSSQIFKSEVKPVSNTNGAIQNNAIWIQPSRGLIWRYDFDRSKFKTFPYTLQVGIRNASASNLAGVFKQVNWQEFPSLILERIDLRFNVLTNPNDASNRWIIQLVRQNQESNTLIGMVSDRATNGLPVATNNKVTLLPVVTLNAIDADTFGLALEKIGSPGAITISATFTYSYLES